MAEQKYRPKSTGYTEQLEEWEVQTGRKRAELTKLTGCFDFGETARKGQMRDDTWSKTLDAPPSRSDGKYNLYKVLGVFYACQQVTEAQILDFLRKYRIQPHAEGREWQNDIWKCFEEGANNARELLRTFPSEKVDTRNGTNSLSPKKLRWAGLLSLLIAAGLVLAFSAKSPMPEPTPAKPTLPCTGSTIANPPPFLPEQGFSVYKNVSDTSKSSPLANSVRSLGINSQGIWLGYAGVEGKTISGVSYYDKAKDQWLHCDGLPLIAGQNVNDFAFQGNNIWVAIDGGSDNHDAPGVAELTDAGWRLFGRNEKDRLPSNVVYSVYVDKDDMVWAMTYEGVAKLVEDHWQTVYQAKEGELPCNEVHKFIDDNKGNRWFALVKCGIARLGSDGKWTSYYNDTDGIKNARGLAMDNQGGIWVTTDGGGVLRFFNDQWATFNTSELLNSHDVKVDKFGRVWVATTAGVFYSSDFGTTWKKHSSLHTLGIELGCSGCQFDENHIWFALKDNGVGHIRIPPEKATISFVSVPALKKLHPKEEYVFQVEVQILAEGLHESDGDSLRSSLPDGTDLFGAWPIIKMTQDEVAIGQKYIFSNIKNKIIAPDKPGKYQTVWRVFQGRRFVSEPIVIEFEVGN